MLADQGPHFDMVIRRTKFAEIGDWKAAMRQPKVYVGRRCCVPLLRRPLPHFNLLLLPSASKQRRKRNVSKDAFGETVGRIHMEKQDYAKLVLHRPRALKKRHSEVSIPLADGLPLPLLTPPMLLTQRNGNEAKRQRVEEEGEEE